MVKNTLHGKLNKSNKINPNQKKDPAPTNDNRPHWCGDCAGAGRQMKDGPCPGHIKNSKAGGKAKQSGAGADELVTSGSVTAVLSELINKSNFEAKTLDTEDVKKLNDILNTQFNPEILADLMNGSLKLISIKNEADIGKLTIEWNLAFLSQATLSGEVKQELIRFINAIEKELETFINQNGIQAGGFTKDIKMDNNTGMPKSLVITFANRNHYENFYKQLDQNVLSKINNVEVKDRKHDVANSENKFNPTPKSLSTKLEKE